MVKKTAKDLVSVVQASREWLLELDEQTVRHRPTPDRWSIAEVIGHLVDSATNNHHRFIRAQESDVLEFPKYEQNFWAETNRYHEYDWSNLVELWYQYNCLLAHVIVHVPENQLATPCNITTYEPCTLEFLITDYLDHLNHHLVKIRERLESH